MTVSSIGDAGYAEVLKRTESKIKELDSSAEAHKKIATSTTN